jgi:hypothetical protein
VAKDATVAKEATVSGLSSDLTLIKKLSQNKFVINETTSQAILYDDDGTTPLVTWALTDRTGLSIKLTGRAPANRGTPS